MYIVVSDVDINIPAPPNLPLAPGKYDSHYQDALNNVFRLYLNRVYALQSYLNLYDPSQLVFPNGQFYQDGSTTTTAALTNNSTTPIPVVSTAPLANSGYVLIGTEIIQYTGRTSTTLTGITRGVLGTSGNKAAWPSGSPVTDVQGTGSGTTIGQVNFTGTDYSNSIALNPSDDTKVVFSKAGLYNLAVTIQLLNFTNTADNVTVWIRKNGVDVPNSATIQTVPANHGTVGGAIVFAFEQLQQIAAGDYLQMAWTSDSGNSVVATLPAGTAPVHPVSTACNLAIQFVSAS